MDALHAVHSLHATNATSSPNVATVVPRVPAGSGLRGHAHVAHAAVANASPSSSRKGSHTQDRPVRLVSAHACKGGAGAGATRVPHACTSPPPATAVVARAASHQCGRNIARMRAWPYAQPAVARMARGKSHAKRAQIHLPTPIPSIPLLAEQALKRPRREGSDDSSYGGGIGGSAAASAIPGVSGDEGTVSAQTLCTAYHNTALLPLHCMARHCPFVPCACALRRFPVVVADSAASASWHYPAEAPILRSPRSNATCIWCSPCNRCCRRVA